jgi:hypothetical protein
VTDGLDPDELAIALRVLKESEELDPEHPDVLALRRATARHFKFVKKARKDAKRDEVSEADKAVVARTATGSPQRIDDETDGIPLVSSAKGAIAGHYQRARPCYICKQDYTQVDAFYHQLCPSCAAISHAKREQRTDLTGRRALLTARRSACTSRCGCCATGRTPPSRPAFPTTRYADSAHYPTAPSGSTASRSSASTCAIQRRSSPWPTRWPRTGRWTS